MKREHVFWIIVIVALMFYAGMVSAQESLPFPEPPSASTAGKTLKDSKHQWRTTPSHLPKDAPNIVIFMTDDAGFSNPSTFGGPGPSWANFLTEIDQWVETGKAPDQITAYFVDEKMQSAGSRLLCAHPQVAKYDGKGDTRDVSSFSCVDGN